MADAWLCDFGIRVTNLERSVEFYTKLLDLDELKRVADDDSAYVLFRDRRSGQGIELNWYSESNPFWAPYHPGEGLDHIDVRVRDVPTFLERLRGFDIVPVNRKLWVNSAAVEKIRADPQASKLLEMEIWTTAAGHRIVYVPDPDGNLICLYDHPEEPWEDRSPTITGPPTSFRGIEAFQKPI